MKKARPDKTFGLRSSTDLYLKLLYDIKRLKAARFTADARYSAFDCAVTGFHIVDWVLQEVDEAQHVALTGVGKNHRPKRGERGAIRRFIDQNDEQLGGVEYCRQIANSVKHMYLTSNPIMKDMSTGTSVKLLRDGDRFVGSQVNAYIKVKDEKIPVIELFQDTARQWRNFLVDEGLWVDQPPEWDE